MNSFSWKKQSSLSFNVNLILYCITFALVHSPTVHDITFPQSNSKHNYAWYSLFDNKGKTVIVHNGKIKREPHGCE